VDAGLSELAIRSPAGDRVQNRVELVLRALRDANLPAFIAERDEIRAGERDEVSGQLRSGRRARRFDADAPDVGSWRLGGGVGKASAGRTASVRRLSGFAPDNGAGGDRMKSIRLIGVLFVVAACVALTGAALANKGSRPARQLPHQARLHRAAPLAKPALLPKKTLQSTGEPDTDTIQAGDQTTPDQPGEQPSDSESENGPDYEAGQQGEPAQGHEDPPGQDVNHECTGDCQE
jgi:hypothetical protein